MADAEIVVCRDLADLSHRAAEYFACRPIIRRGIIEWSKKVCLLSKIDIPAEKVHRR